MQSRTLLSAAIFCLFPLFLPAQLCLPSVTLHNGLSVEVHPIDSDGDGITDFAGAAVRLHDLVLRADDRCNSGPLTFGMRKSGTGSGMTTDSMLVYNCTELGTQAIEIWVRNANGLSNYSETYILVQDNSGACAGPSHVPQPAACVADGISPEIFSINGLSGPLRTGSSGEPYLSVSVSNLIHTVYDNCGGPYQYRLRKSGTGIGVPKDTTVVFNCDERGIQIVEVWAGDPAGNWSFNETYISVQDNAGICDAPPLSQPAGCLPDKTPPELLVYNGISQGVVWESAGPLVRVYATDFIRLGRDKCHDNLGWRIEKSTGILSAKPPKSASSSVTFSCDELGTQLVDIWLRDGAGNWTKAESYVLVQDNTGACGPGSGLHQVVIPEFKQEIVARLGGKPAETTPREARPATAPALQISVWPNPATDGFTLRASLGHAGPVSIYLYDNVGGLVHTLAGQLWMEAGIYQQYFSRPSLPAGVYHCVLHSAQGVQTVAVVLQ